MMTFDEACEAVFTFDADKAEDIGQLRHSQHGFLGDIENSRIARNARALSEAIAIHVMETLGDPSQIGPNIFINALSFGVAIGVLMEKREE